MNYTTPTANGQPAHLQVAIEMANSLLSQFSLGEQNEAVSMICQRIREARINEKHELQMRVETIDKSLQEIPLTESKGDLQIKY